MDEDLPSQVTEYNLGDHTTNALKTNFALNFIYIPKPD
jgi:hypothetical protein